MVGGKCGDMRCKLSVKAKRGWLVRGRMWWTSNQTSREVWLGKAGQWGVLKRDEVASRYISEQERFINLCRCAVRAAHTLVMC